VTVPLGSARELTAEATTGFEPVIAVLQFARSRPGLSPAVPFRPVLNCARGPQFRLSADASDPVQPCWVAIGLQPWRKHLCEGLQRPVAGPSDPGSWTYPRRSWLTNRPLACQARAGAFPRVHRAYFEIESRPISAVSVRDLSG
jgi:hypothetical protein